MPAPACRACREDTYGIDKIVQAPGRAKTQNTPRPGPVNRAWPGERRARTPGYLIPEAREIQLKEEDVAMRQVLPDTRLAILYHIPRSHCNKDETNRQDAKVIIHRRDTEDAELP